MKDSTLKIILGAIAVGAGTVASGLGVVAIYEGLKDKAFEEALENGDIEITDF